MALGLPSSHLGNSVPSGLAARRPPLYVRGHSGVARNFARLLTGRFRPVFAQAFVWCSFAAAVLVSPPAIGAQDATSVEYRNKANFLVRFLDFIEWPEAAFSSPEAPFLICVRGDFSFDTALAEQARNSTPHRRRIDVLWLRGDQKSRVCHVVFVSRSESRRYAEVLQAANGPGVLTVGETPDFLEAGGAMSFVVKVDANQRQVLQFEVNLVAATDAQLKISSKLLAVARRVVNRPEPKKG
jgi:hypothetical protein